MKKTRKKREPRVPKRIPGASDTDELQAIFALHEKGKSVDEIAEASNRHHRHVTEVLRIFEKCIPQLRQRVSSPDRVKAISVRVAARAADLPPNIQKMLAPQLEGKDQREGLRIIRTVEKGKIHRGQKPKFPLIRKVSMVCFEMEKIVIARLKEVPADPDAKVAMRVLRVLRGDLDAANLLPRRKPTAASPRSRRR